MPLIGVSTYRPPAHLWNGHLQTIIPSVFRKIPVRYVRERILTPDGDFLDLDWCRATPQNNTTPNPLVIVSHGLEGDTTRQYVAGTVRELTRRGLDCLAWHYRSCSGEMNRHARFYHIGETGDLHTVVQWAGAAGYTTVSLVGFSAGGNITLKYLGEQATATLESTTYLAINRAVAISVPLHLPTTANRLEQWDSLFYNHRFQRTLKAKIRQKSAALPDSIRAVDLTRITSLRQFDDQITAPLHGFGNAENYYRVNSSLAFLPNINVPVLVLNARNDPFLSAECFPVALATELTHVWMEFPEQGGHCGFPSAEGLTAPTYAEQRTADFLTNPTLTP